MTEALEHIKSKKESETELKGFIKKFIKLTPKKAKELKEKLEKMDMLKLKESNIAKIIDIMPKDKENLNKIFTDVSLTEDESKQILDTIEEFR